jgi:hypothetical protein
MRLSRLLAFRLGLLGLLIVGLSLFGNTGSLTQSTAPSNNPSFILQRESASGSKAAGSTKTTPSTNSNSNSVAITGNGNTSITTKSSSTSTTTTGSTTSQVSGPSPIVPIQLPTTCYCGGGKFPTCSYCADPLPPTGGCPPCYHPPDGHVMCAMYCRVLSPELAEPQN